MTGLTNAQVALMAAVEISDKMAFKSTVLGRAEDYLQWLDKVDKDGV